MDNNSGNKVKDGRFKKLKHYSITGTSQMYSRNHIQKYTPQEFEIADFYSRLYTLYGEPNSLGIGSFDYYIHDTETGEVFIVYITG